MSQRPNYDSLFGNLNWCEKVGESDSGSGCILIGQSPASVACACVQNEWMSGWMKIKCINTSRWINLKINEWVNAQMVGRVAFQELEVLPTFIGISRKCKIWKECNREGTGGRETNRIAEYLSKGVRISHPGPLSLYGQENCSQERKWLAQNPGFALWG